LRNTFFVYRILRLEGEIIEIIGEIVGCLGVKSANCERATELIDRLTNHQTELTPLILKKHPEIVDVVRKVWN